MFDTSRRQLLRTTGVALAVGVAGCSSDSGTDGEDSGTDGQDGSSASGITADATYDAPVSDPAGILYKEEYNSEQDADVPALVVADGSAQEEYVVELDGISETVKARYTPDTGGDEVSARGIAWNGRLLLNNAATNTLVETNLESSPFGPDETSDLPAEPKGLTRHETSTVVYVVLARPDGDVLAELNNDLSVRRETPIPGGTGYGVFTQTRGGTTKTWVNDRNARFHSVQFGEGGSAETFDIEFGPVTDVATAGQAAERAWALTEDGQIAEFSPPPISEE